ncbi:MAG: aspartate aminotransferase family protein [Phycisphaeraceae bacterium]
MQARTIHPPMPPCDYRPPPYVGPSRQEVLANRERYVNPAVFAYYEHPVMIVDGHMQYLFDESGKRYLDLFGGIVTVSCGHCHPKVIARAREQLQRLQHTTTIYLHPLMGQLAAKLASHMPDGLDVSYFVNSGSEANDLAVTMARLWSGNHTIIALQNGYHGAVSSVAGLTSHHTWKYPLPQDQGVVHVSCPDPSRSRHDGSPSQIARKALADLEDAIRYGTTGKVAGLIAEPIQGVGGVTAGTAEYLQGAYDIVRRHGGVCIADEVQTGFGRTGEHFWGFERFGVTPDIVTMAKGIGNGAPLAAVTTRPDIASVLAQRLHFNTFGGNPVSMAQGLGVLEVIEEENLQDNARLVGAHLKARLLGLQQKHELMADVRGAGLMLGVELARDRACREPATAETAWLMEAARERGVLLGKGGLYGNVLRIAPPLCVTVADADFAVNVLDDCLARISSQAPDRDQHGAGDMVDGMAGSGAADGNVHIAEDGRNEA